MADNEVEASNEVEPITTEVETTSEQIEATQSTLVDSENVEVDEVAPVAPTATEVETTSEQIETTQSDADQTTGPTELDVSAETARTPLDELVDLETFIKNPGYEWPELENKPQDEQPKAPRTPTRYEWGE